MSSNLLTARYRNGCAPGPTDDPDFKSRTRPRNPTRLPPLPEYLEPLPRLINQPFRLLWCLKHAKYQSGVFVVSTIINGKETRAILKLYHTDTPPNRSKNITENRMFDRECRAYQNLIHYGLCDDGLVPSFFGIIELSTWGPHLNVPASEGGEDLWRFFQRDVTPPKAILIEYLPNMRHLRLSNFSESVALAAMRSLVRIHEAYVLHDDFTPRNILVGTDGLVVIIDFGDATVHPDHTSAFRGSVAEFMEAEYNEVWEMMFMLFLPDCARMLRGERPWYLYTEQKLLQDGDEFKLVEDDPGSVF